MKKTTMSPLRLFVLLVTSSPAQGLLAPPGPSAPLFKTLNQVEPRIPITNLPFVILQPGSYYFVTNLITAGNGIIISNSDVTVDLNGFLIQGGTGVGIGNATLSITNITIRNGTISSWAGSGVNVSLSQNSLFEELHVEGNGISGLLAGIGSVVQRCLAQGNGTDGIAVGNDSTVRDCVARDNNNRGLVVGARSVALNCVASGNSSNGIESGNAGLVANCSASANNGVGILTVAHCFVLDSSARANTNDGILVSNDCHVRGNTCNSNGSGSGSGAGIHAFNVNNRIDDNMVNANDRGIAVDLGGNLIIRNSAADNAGGSNYVIVAGNSVGTITNVSAITVNVANPWANFEY